MSQIKVCEPLSIALCTFNGEKFLSQQLKSLVDQKFLPLEIVIQDDGSSDRSVDIIRNFAAHSPVDVRLQSNASTLGFVQNFAKSIDCCEGEFIALCDQDDVWISSKTSRILNILQDPEVGLVFSNAELVDHELRPIGCDMWKMCNFTRKELALMLDGNATVVLLKHYVVTGATLAFRSKYKSLILPIPDGWHHDAWIALLISAVARVSPLRENLVLYRQHSANAIGGIRPSLVAQIKKNLFIDRREYYETEITRHQQLHQRLVDHSEFHPVQSSLESIELKLRHLEVRASLPTSRWKRLPGIFREIYSTGYSRFSRNWGSVALDIFIR